ncbi:hypothetical protein DMC64_09445 [Amycolatopsis sp. WAC 04197]|uniref:hypothetical protein n=1 Tax=Amycolatopsis sp. WAC 04197 TaxID=2203199 RepID=UPI000F771E78|nr:hypothetical protein [Amycolatopsis sp. WAC 04197]RSN47486.1 hypothetical protein DMC64_09445 [Amycolatopsis sp. WAC 04197]
MRKLWGVLALSLLAACVPGQSPPGEAKSALGFAARPGEANAFGVQDPVAEIQRLFRPGPDRTGVALTRAGRTVIGVGFREFPGEGRSDPIAWVSGDGGTREIVLPQDRPGHWAPTAIAADGDRVLVTAALGGDVRVWASGDAGATWTVSQVLVRASDVWFSTALRAGGKWLLAGGSAAGALVLTGEPGAWELAPLGDGRILGGTVGKAGEPVLFGDRVEWNRGKTSNRSCSVVWVGQGGWQRGELGCPAGRLIAAMTLDDGRVVLKGDRALWVRPS